MSIELSEQEQLRRQSLAALRELGIDPYPAARYEVTATAREIAENFDETKGNYGDVRIAGRIMTRRIMGSASFFELQDHTGRIQVYIRRDDICPEGDPTLYNTVFKKLLDIGDFIGVEGFAFHTNTGELSVHCRKFTVLSKSIRPLPVVKQKDGQTFDAFTDPEVRYRQRYVDLAVNPQVREVFVKRAKIISTMREFFNSKGYVEVETPILQPIPGGAAARPFITHHNALDMDMYLRIAPELYLKRLVVGGFERVFEINRNFRNEGVSVRHNPEFTMMEFYCTYWTYRDQMQFTEDLLRTAAREATGSAILPYQGHEIDLEKPFDRLTPVEAILKYSPDYTAEQLADEAFLRAELVRLGEPQPDYVGLGALQMALFEETTEAKLIQPTFIIDYPTEISPLARASDANHDVTERFELFIAGRELGNGFSELNDPDDQAARFKAQADAKSHGDDEAMYYDADYIRALEYGLPPTAGCGVGIDRFIMLLTDAPTIRDVLLFPHMRPESGN